MYYFILGYTAKVAGTESGVSEPQATFSYCFGAPFLPRPPAYYANMLKQRMEKNNASVWLLNTGISGGPYGVGSRIPLPETRALVKAAINGTLDNGEFVEVPTFGLRVPASCPGVDSKLLQPRNCWENSSEYDQRSSELSKRFEEELKVHNS